MDDNFHFMLMAWHLVNSLILYIDRLSACHFSTKNRRQPLPEWDIISEDINRYLQ